MLFNTFQFVAFLLVVFTIHSFLPARGRNPFLLVASLYFYMCWNPRYVGLILLAMAINYTAALLIDRSTSEWFRGITLTVALIGTFSMLFFYKYLDFAITTVNQVSHALGGDTQFNLVHLLLPAGISFFTFQTASYSIDVFNRRLRAEQNLLDFMCFVTFFPQLVAGPIERAEHLLPQIKSNRVLLPDNIVVGLRWILMGLFKKMVVADACAVVVSTVYNYPERFTGPLLMLGPIFFAFQVYGDFAGYSDIAVGVGRLFGVRLMINFRQPYMARSIAEYWQRWHISLTTWFRDYVYIPLGGNRVGQLRYVFNIFAIFLTSGLWHGANWTYVVWGALHAVYFLVQHYLRPGYRAVTEKTGLVRVPYLLPIVEWLSMWAMVLFGYIIFRATSLNGAYFMMVNMFDMENFNPGNLVYLGLQKFELAMVAVWMVVTLGLDYCLAFQPPWALRAWNYRPIRWAIYVAGFWAIALFGVFENVEFIYFQF